MEERKNIRQVFLDTETTGKKKEIDRIVEIALVEAIDGVPTGRFFHTLINPEGKAIPEDATKIHGITDADVADKPLFKEVAAEIVDFIRDSECLAYNIDFDAGFINMEMGKAGISENYWEVTGNNVDVLKIARAVFPGQRNSLDKVLERFNIDKTQRETEGHGALIDTQLMIQAYTELLKHYDVSKPDLESDIPRSPVRYLNLGNYVPLEISLTEEELTAHEKYLDKIQEKEKVTPLERKKVESDVPTSPPKRPSI
ncbi:exonuclease domain-containing protein [Shigella flexneri]